MKRMISVLDVNNGRIYRRASDTPTLDLPVDFDRKSGVASLDERSRAHCLDSGGKALVYPAFTRPLSWRVRGEECLVASVSTRSAPSGFRLSAVEPAEA